jgi:hypothetical protein
VVRPARTVSQGEALGQILCLPLGVYAVSRRRKTEVDSREASVRKLLFCALVEEWLGQPYEAVADRLTRSERGRVNRAVAELRAVGVDDPDEIHRRALIYRVRFPGCPVTPQALTANWTVCSEPPQKLSAPEANGLRWQDVDAALVENETRRLCKLVEAGKLSGFVQPLDETEREVIAFWLQLEREYRTGKMIPERVRTLDVLRRWVLARRESVLPVPTEVSQLMRFYRTAFGWRPPAAAAATGLRERGDR